MELVATLDWVQPIYFEQLIQQTPAWRQALWTAEWSGSTCPLGYARSFEDQAFRARRKPIM